MLLTEAEQTVRCFCNSRVRQHLHPRFDVLKHGCVVLQRGTSRAATFAFHWNVLLVLVAACADRQANGKVARFAKDRTHVLDFFTQSRFEFSRTVVHETSILWLWVKVVAGEDVVAIFAENVGRELQGLVVRKGEVGDGASLWVLIVFAVEFPTLVPQVSCNLLYVFVQGCFVRLAVRFKVDLQAIEVVARIAVAIQVGGVVGKSNDTGVRRSYEGLGRSCRICSHHSRCRWKSAPSHPCASRPRPRWRSPSPAACRRARLFGYSGRSRWRRCRSACPWRLASSTLQGTFAGPKLDVTTVGVYNVDLAAIVRALVVLGNLRCPPGTVARRHDVASAARAVRRTVGVGGVSISERRVCRTGDAHGAGQEQSSSESIHLEYNSRVLCESKCFFWVSSARGRRASVGERDPREPYH